MRIGPIEVDRPICLAPMEDVTDFAFRLICRRMGADIVYTEFTSSDALIREARKAMRKVIILDEERPVAIQLFGGGEESMEGAARVAEQFRPDFIDINCGCWVRNVAMRGEGAGLLRDLPRFEKIVRSTVKATSLPVTVKTRLGWDENSIVILDAAKMVEQAGVQALTIHCRTRSQAHEGKADWSWLPKIKSVVSIPVIGNGDLQSAQDVKAMFETGCDGVMIGRSAIGNPWIFKQSRHYLQTGELLPPPTLRERIDVCLEHLKLSVQCRGLPHGVLTFRKFYAGYFRGLPNIAKLRNDLMLMLEVTQIEDRLNAFEREQSVLAGV
ncbi:MAG: tRNA dihydrouridine synthase DusB [Candidatus Omnitrophota bacterium]|nr:tRNA dihydrouridine synthase DusB [Candidatus Omnitrophota bacterium]MDZ4242639.1 tRNA dihydrouridine synthase DusB [Candidatus Omnitrophota bacterium]